MHQASINQWNAEDYANNSSAQEKWALELIRKLKLAGNEHVLDIGCGDGRITHEIARLVPSGTVVGFDASEKMIAMSRTVHQEANLSFYHMDAVNFHLEQKFDVVFSNAVLHWIKDIPGVLRNVRIHLNPGGRLLFQMGGAGNAEDILRIIESVMAAEKWRGYFQDFEFPYQFCSVGDYEKWLPEAGFDINRIELLPKDMVHENREGLKGWLRTTWFPYTDCIPGTEKELFLTRCLDAYLAAFPEDGTGRTHVRMVRLEVEAFVS